MEPSGDIAMLAAELLAERQEQPSLDRIVTLAVQTIDPCSYCSITLGEPGSQLSVVAATGPIAREAAELQDQLSDGPSLDTSSDLGTVSIEDLSTDPRWPRWARRACSLGIGSVLTIHLSLGGRPQIATLNLYATAPHAFDSTDLAVASILARLAATAIDAAHHEQGLRAAARSRQTIGVAQGLLMQRFGLTLDQSFELLVRYSQDHNIKLRTLAQRLAEAGRVPATGDAADDLDRAFRLDNPPPESPIR